MNVFWFSIMWFDPCMRPGSNVETYRITFVRN